MKKRPLILFAITLTLFLILQQRTPKTQLTSPQKNQQKTARYSTLLPNPATSNSIPTHLSTNPIPLIKKEHKFDQLLLKFDPEFLEKYQGSYRFSDLNNEKETTPSLSIHTSWFIWNTNTPKAKIKLEKDPNTGNYKINGGEISLPKDRISISHEKDPDKNETRTYLNFKKKF